MNEFYITRDKYLELVADLQRLKKEERPAIIKAIQEARALGDLSENAEYSSAKEKQGLIETRISELQAKISHARILDESKIRTDVVVVGVRVSLRDLETGDIVVYTIVGRDDADYSVNRISNESPVGKVMIGKKIGDKVLVRAPGGSTKYELVGIEKAFN